MREPDVDLDGSELTGVIRRAEPDLLPRVSSGPKVGVSLRLDPDVMEQLLREAGHRGIGHAVLTQELIEAGLGSMHAEQVMVPLADAQRVSWPNSPAEPLHQQPGPGRRLSLRRTLDRSPTKATEAQVSIAMDKTDRNHAHARHLRASWPPCLS